MLLYLASSHKDNNNREEASSSVITVEKVDTLRRIASRNKLMRERNEQTWLQKRVMMKSTS